MPTRYLHLAVKSVTVLVFLLLIISFCLLLTFLDDFFITGLCLYFSPFPSSLSFTHFSGWFLYYRSVLIFLSLLSFFVSYSLFWMISLLQVCASISLPFHLLCLLLTFLNDFFCEYQYQRRWDDNSKSTNYVISVRHNMNRDHFSRCLGENPRPTKWSMNGVGLGPKLEFCLYPRRQFGIRARVC